MVMLGEQVGQQDRLFYEFDIEDRVPHNHLLRRLDGILDLSWLRAELLPFYSHTGRPSVDPELMIRMLLVGYCYSIRSERRLCQEVELNLAYRWFCRLGLEDSVPDHSSFSVNRHGRFRDSDVLRKLFESIVHRCMEAGLVGGEGFAVDASVIEADASRFARVEGSEVDWTQTQRSSRPVREYLAALEAENAPTNPARKPKAMSPTDPTAAWTTRGRNKVMFGYSLNYLIDMENAVVLDVEATPTRISKWDKGKRDDGTFSRADFAYDKDRDLYVCPAGKTLKTTGKLHSDKTYRYLASKFDCDPCPLKHKCCPKTPSRKVPRTPHEEARDHARSLMETEAYDRSRVRRKKIERLFGEAKRNLALTRLRLRGLTGAQDEFLMTATVQNLKRLAKLAAIPPPQPMIA
jgi:transposase